MSIGYDRRHLFSVSFPLVRNFADFWIEISSLFHFIASAAFRSARFAVESILKFVSVTIFFFYLLFSLHDPTIPAVVSLFLQLYIFSISIYLLMSIFLFLSSRETPKLLHQKSIFVVNSLYLLIFLMSDTFCYCDTFFLKEVSSAA